MSTLTIPTTAIPSTRRSHRLLRSGSAATVTAAVVCEALATAARVAQVPMRAADPGAAAAKAIPVGGIGVAVLMNAAIGLLVAAGLVRWVKSPAKVFTVVATSYAALSLLGPVFAAHTHLATKLVLSAAHVAAAVIIIPRVTAALGEAD